MSLNKEAISWLIKFVDVPYSQMTDQERSFFDAAILEANKPEKVSKRVLSKTTSCREIAYPANYEGQSYICFYMPKEYEKLLKIAAIKQLRNDFGIGLREAKVFTETPKFVIRSEDINYLRQTYEEFGIEVEFC